MTRPAHPILRVADALLALVLLPAFASPAPAQHDAAAFASMLRRLAIVPTEWNLWRDLADKARAHPAAARQALTLELAAAKRGQPEAAIAGKYRARLLGVWAEVDADAGLEALVAGIRDPDASVASIAARLLGRLEVAAPDVVGAHLLAAWKAEEIQERRGPREALLVAMGELGWAGLAKPLEQRLRPTGKRKRRPLAPHLATAAQLTLAQVVPTTGPEADRFAKLVPTWLGEADGPTRLAAIRLAEKLRVTAAVPPLVELATKSNDLRAEALAALGAIGGPVATKALVAAGTKRRRRVRDAWAYRPGSDDIYLALLRLEHEIGYEWALDQVRRFKRYPEPDVDRLPGLFASWGLKRAPASLEVWIGDRDANDQFRIGVARALCRLQDPRGLDLLAEILGAGNNDYTQVPAAQEALHEFVGNADRPDYLRLWWREKRLTTYREDRVETAAKAWAAWLAAHRDEVRWRRPFPEHGTFTLFR